MKRTLLLAFLSVSVLSVGALAEDSSVMTQTAVFPTLGVPVQPAGTSPGVFITNISTGKPVPGYPCYACVTSGAIGEPQALYLLSANSAFTTSVQIQDTAFTGNLKVDLTLVQNSKVVLSASTTFEGLIANEVGVVQFNGTLPATTGATVAEVKILSGTKVVGQATSNLYIQ